MKKLVFMFATIVAVSLASCGGKKADTNATEVESAVAVEEVITETEEAPADSTVVVEEEVVVAE